MYGLLDSIYQFGGNLISITDSLTEFLNGFTITSSSGDVIIEFSLWTILLPSLFAVYVSYQLLKWVTGIITGS